MDWGKVAGGSGRLTPVPNDVNYGTNPESGVGCRNYGHQPSANALSCQGVTLEFRAHRDRPSSPNLECDPPTKVTQLLTRAISYQLSLSGPPFPVPGSRCL